MHQFHKALFFFFVLLFPLQYLKAQEQDKVQSKQYYELAKEMVTATKAVDDARELMVVAANFDTTNVMANFEAGYMHIKTINKDLAEKYFNRVYRQQPTYRFDLEYWIGLSYQYGLQFDKAIDFYDRYKTKISKTSTNYSGKDKVPASEVDRRIVECNNGKEFISQPKAFSITNLGSEVNSEFDDYAPVVDSAETEMVFTTRRREGNINENVWDDNKPYEDIFISKKVDGKWEKAKNIGISINNRFNDSNLTLSPNGNILFIYKDGIGEGDIFFSERQPDGTWNKPKPLPGTINSPYRESSASMTNDESTIYFASERPGGLGGSDIYAARKNAKGLWSVIVNLGPSINTPFEDEAPYIDYDSKTLYFSSMGRKGMGGHDVFRATLLNQETNQWSEPENLGYPINTPDDDIFVTGTSTPNRFYYASERAGGFGYSDIYLITDQITDSATTVINKSVERTIHPHKFVLTVLDADTGEPVKAIARMRGVDNTSIVSTNVDDGVYEFVILSHEPKNYIVYAEMDGYIFENIEISLGGTTEANVTDTKTIKLRKIKTGAVSVLRHVFFDTDKAILKPESFDELDKLELLLERNSKVRVEIGGHTDDVGTHEYNMQLSQKRANAVRTYLMSKGLEAKRITAVGYGETDPVVSNDDEIGGREINRRVEFKILQN